MNKTPRWRRWAIGLTAIIVVADLGIWATIWWENRRVEAIIRQIRERGEPATPEDLDRFHVGPPKEQDVTDMLLMAGSLIGHTGASPNDPFRKLAFVGSASEEQDEPRPLTPWKQLPLAKQYLLDRAQGIQLLHAALERGGHARLPVDYSSGYICYSPNAIELANDWGRALTLEAFVEAYSGQPSKVSRSIVHALRLQIAIESEPISMTQLVRFAFIREVLDVLRRLLRNRNFTDADLQALESELGSIDCSNGFRLSLLCDRVRHLDGIRRGLIDYDCRNNPLTELRWRFVQSTWQRTFFVCARESERYLQVCGLPYQAAMTKLAIWDDESLVRCRQDPVLGIRFAFVPPAGQALDSFARCEARIRSARTAIAFERFRLSTGRWPANLDELVPRFLPKVLLDPIDEQPLKFKIDGDHYKVYSVGPNGIDDGGLDFDSIVNGEQLRKQLDIVFEPLPPIPKAPAK